MFALFSQQAKNAEQIYFNRNGHDRIPFKTNGSQESANKALRKPK